MLDNLFQDLRFTLRSWRRQPATAVLAILTLALGIGANAAIFSVVYGVLLQPLPYSDPDELMTVWLDNRLQGWHQDVTSYPTFEDWKARSRTFDNMAALSVRYDSLTGVGDPIRVRAMQVSPTFFDVLGVSPELGRTFAVADWERDEGLVVLAHAAWQQRHGADPDILGNTLSLNGNPYTVVGVMPPGFAYLHDDVEVWRLFPSTITESPRGQLWLDVVGRLRDGVTLEQTRADMDEVGRQLEKEYPDVAQGYGVTVVPLHEHVVGDVRPALLVLLGSVGLVLLIACANVASLMLTRAIARRREIAVRAALGASGARIAWQTFTESLALALVGGTAGLGVAALGLATLQQLQPNVPRLAEVGLDPTILSFTLVVSVLTGVLFGAVPALHARATDLAGALRDRSGNGDSGAAIRGTLVAGEIALALVLLIGAGLLMRSYSSLTGMSPGFDAPGVLSFRVSLTGPEYEDGNDARVFFMDVLDRIRALPGVNDAGAVWHLPLGTGFSSGYFTVEGRSPVPRSQLREIKRNIVTPEYFGLMRTPIVAGRGLTHRDTQEAQRVVVINETSVRLFFAGEDPVGQRFLFGTPAGYATDDDPNPELPWYTIVGVVGDVRQRTLTSPVEPEVFGAFDQRPVGTLTYVLRTDGDPAALAAASRAAVWSVDNNLPIAGMTSLEGMLSNGTAGERFNLTVLGVFAVLALSLAVIGIYGVMSYWVRQQTRDIGLRMALGAGRRDVLGLVLRQTVRITAAGVALGVVGAMLLSRLMTSLLFGVRPLDPMTFAVVPAAAALVAMATSYLPARRATGVDPIEALRQD